MSLRVKTKGQIFFTFIAGNSAKISVGGQTCGRNEKTGTFYLVNREECACTYYHENARFREDLRENKRKTRVRYEPPFWSE